LNDNNQKNKTANAAALLEARHYKGKNLITPGKAYRVKNVKYNVNLRLFCSLP
jgi:hypothetical protein